MCQTKPRIAVRITTVVAGPVIVLFAETGQAEGFTRVVNDTSDAQAENLGAVNELKLIAPAGPEQETPAEARALLARAFRRLGPKTALLVELREVVEGSDEDGPYWTGLALWAHGPAAPAASSQPEA